MCIYMYIYVFLIHTYQEMFTKYRAILALVVSGKIGFKSKLNRLGFNILLKFIVHQYIF